MDFGEGSSRGPNHNSGIPHNVSTASGPGIAPLSDQDYWKAQLKIYKDALTALNKSEFN